MRADDPIVQLPVQYSYSVFENPEFTRWFLGQSVAFVGVVTVMGLWIWTILREKIALQRRNEELSDYFTRHIESDLRERANSINDFALREDSARRNLLDFFKWLAERQESTASAGMQLSRAVDPNSEKTPTRR